MGCHALRPRDAAMELVPCGAELLSLTATTLWVYAEAVEN
jgi:hypothetical protein